MRIILTVALALFVTPAVSEPSYKLNQAQTRAISLSGLSLNGDGCHPMKMSGRVSEQQFAGTWVVGFTLASEDGSRVYVNVDPFDLDSVGSRVALAWINDGLQKMLREGSHVEIEVEACGASGSVLVLDSVRTR